MKNLKKYTTLPINFGHSSINNYNSKKKLLLAFIIFKYFYHILGATNNFSKNKTLLGRGRSVGRWRNFLEAERRKANTQNC